MDHCNKCHGTGYIDHFKNVKHGVCFKCGGTGKPAAQVYYQAKQISEYHGSTAVFYVYDGFVTWTLCSAEGRLLADRRRAKNILLAKVAAAKAARAHAA